jgi:hypothetical protein
MFNISMNPSLGIGSLLARKVYFRTGADHCVYVEFSLIPVKSHFLPLFLPTGAIACLKVWLLAGLPFWASLGWLVCATCTPFESKYHQTIPR